MLEVGDEVIIRETGRKAKIEWRSICNHPFPGSSINYGVDPPPENPMALVRIYKFEDFVLVNQFQGDAYKGEIDNTLMLEKADV